MQTKRYKTAAVILAAGSGKRMNLSVTKQKLLIMGKSVLKRSLETFASSDLIDLIVVVSRLDELEFAASECADISKIYSVIAGGECRAESAKLGFLSLPEDVEYVLIHDAARCLVTKEDIDSVANAAYKYGAATASYPIVDSVKEIDEFGMIESNVLREKLRAVATPQAFSYEIYNRAIKSVFDISSEITDDNSLVQKIGIRPYCVDTSRDNIKITAKADIAFAEYIIQKRES